MPSVNPLDAFLDKAATHGYEYTIGRNLQNQWEIQLVKNHQTCWQIILNKQSKEWIVSLFGKPQFFLSTTQAIELMEKYL